MGGRRVNGVLAFSGVVHLTFRVVQTLFRLARVQRSF